MDYAKCSQCSRIEILAKSTNGDKKMDNDGWLCEAGVSFVVSDYVKFPKKE